MLQMVKPQIDPIMVLGEAQTYDELAKILQDRRHELGLTQAELGEAAHLQDGYVGKLEASVRKPGRISLYPLLQQLKVKLVIVVSEDDS